MPKKDSLIFDIFSLIKLEKEDKENISDYIHSKNYKIPKLSLGQKMADKLTKFAGSWMFIFLFLIILITWIFINSFWLIYKLWDPFPFILLNLILSTLAAIQAPIILMSQNRAAERYRIKVERDYYVNRKAEREIEELKKDIKWIKNKLSKK
ncbi:MAG TPA: DUF1003 domain-containing protein [Candidatus Nanoarchaeia archaeon]|nr:DUF1003 domain-containing protein [Candidatus Nanoarchaeia archaeon]